MDKNLRINIYIRNTYFLIALGIFIYLILRALYVPVLEDEAATFLRYIQKNKWLPDQKELSANNHLLNTFLSILTYKIFGHGIVQLRLANLLFFPVFAIYLYKITQYLHHSIIRIGCMMAILCVHNLIEYFAYSRGYGLSLALLMGSVYYVLHFYHTKRLTVLWGFYICSFLAMLANLTLINTMLILNILITVSLFRKGNNILIKSMYTMAGFLPLTLITWISLRMKQYGALYYGGDEGLWQATIKSLTQLIYGEWKLMVAIFFIAAGILGLIFLLLGKASHEKKSAYLSPRIVFFLLFIGNLIAYVALRKLFHINYPKDRVAIYLYFLLILFFCFSLDKIRYKKLNYIACLWITVPVHFLLNVNFTHSTFWYYDNLPVNFYQTILQKGGNNPSIISIGGNSRIENIWAYDNQLHKGILNDIQLRDYPSFYYDYLLLYNDEKLEWAKKDYNILLIDPYSNIHLLERKQKIQLVPLVHHEINDILNTKEEFVEFYLGDSLKKHKNLCFEISTTINTPRNIEGYFVLSTEIRKTETSREDLPLLSIKNQWKGENTFHHSIFVPNISPETDKILLYFWNPQKQEISFSKTMVNVYSWN